MGEDSSSSPPEDVPDTELIGRVRTGDTVAFDALFRRYQRRLYSMLYHMTGSHEDADDLVVETFSRAYRSIERYHGKSQFYTWLYAIGSNLALNLLRKRKRRPTTSLDALDEEGFSNDPAFTDLSYTGDTPRQVRARELQEKLNDALLRLSDEHRAVVTMHDIQGMPHQEISEILGVSEGTVRSRLFYARRLLQGMLSDYLQ